MGFGAIQVDFPRTGGLEVVGEPLQFERCPATDVYRARQQRLKGDDNILPSWAFVVGRRSQIGRGPPVHAPRYGIKPNRARHTCSGARSNNRGPQATPHRPQVPQAGCAAASLALLVFASPRVNQMSSLKKGEDTCSARWNWTLSHPPSRRRPAFSPKPTEQGYAC